MLRNRFFWGIIAAGALAHGVVFLALKDIEWRVYLPKLFGGVTPRNFFTGVKYAALPDEAGRRPVVEKQFTVTSTLVKVRPDAVLTAPAPGTVPTTPPHTVPTPPTPAPAPAPAPARKEPSRQPRGSARLFGIPARSQRVVFVLDVSGSMFERTPDGATRMHHARRHLASVIDHLPPQREFDVVLFGGGSVRFRPGPVPATDENKAAAIRFLDSLPDFEGSTDLGAGLFNALALAPGEVFLVTDGMPNTGDRSLLQHVESLRDESGSPRTRIHTIGFFLERDGSDEWFLRELSQRTGGLYVGWRGERLGLR